MEIKIQRTTTPRKKPDIDGIIFGTHFSDHMFLMDYVEGQGWIDPRIVPYGPISLEPSAMVFHYAQEIFEGMKAYRTTYGRIQLFRPMENFRRMNVSADRMCIPRIPEELALKGLATLLKVDRDWVPSAPDSSLYIRPFIIATDPQLGVHVSKTYLFAIITSPVGSYYAGGMSPVRIKLRTRMFAPSGAERVIPSAEATTPLPSGQGRRRKRRGSARCSGWTASTAGI